MHSLHCVISVHCVFAHITLAIHKKTYIITQEISYSSFHISIIIVGRHRIWKVEYCSVYGSFHLRGYSLIDWRFLWCRFWDVTLGISTVFIFIPSFESKSRLIIRTNLLRREGIREINRGKEDMREPIGS